MRPLIELIDRLGGSWWTVVAAVAIGLAGANAVAPHVPRSYEAVREPLRDDAGKLRRSALRDARRSR